MTPKSLPMPVPLLAKLVSYVFILASIYTTWQNSLATMNQELEKHARRITTMETTLTEQAAIISRIDERTRMTLQILKAGGGQ